MRTTAEIRPEMDAADKEYRRLQTEWHEAYRAEEMAAMDKARAEGKTNACGKYWRPDQTCSYCGSMSVAVAIRRLKTPGTSFSGADWKYGWPHKFYIGAHPGGLKFYNKHLEDASPEEFSEFVALADRFFGVKFYRNEKGFKYLAMHGIQKWGTVGANGEPKHASMPT